MADRRRIVLVDDDRDFLFMNRRVLEGRGFDVSCHADCEEALRSIEERPPDLIVTDLMMSRLDSGFVFAGILGRSETLRRIPLIIVTAIGTKMGFDFAPQDETDLKAMGARAFFTKPVDPAAFVSKIQELLEESPEE